MASGEATLSLARLPRALPREDNNLLGFVQLAILRGLDALVFLACLALIVFVSGTSVFSVTVLALCLRLRPRSPDRQQRRMIHLTSMEKIQLALQFLEAHLHANLHCQLVCPIRLVEIVLRMINGEERFGEPQRPSPKRLHSPEHRQQLPAPRSLKAQRGSHDYCLSYNPAQKNKRPKRGEDSFPSGWRAAGGGDHESPFLPYHTPSPQLQQQSHLPIQGPDCFTGQSSQGLRCKGRHPCSLHPSQPCHIQLPTPPETPRPPSVPSAPKYHLLPAAAPRPVVWPPSSTGRDSPKVQRRTSQSRPSSKQPEIHILRSLPLADTSRREQPQRTELNLSLKHPRPSFETGGHLRPTQTRPPFDAEPDGIIHVGGDRKRSRGGPGSSRPQGNAASAQNTNGNEECPNLPWEDESESDHEHRDLDPDRNDKTTPDRKARDLFFRCPMYCTNPRMYARSHIRCSHWRNCSIAAVTRHALNDAGEGSVKWHKIKELSSAKLSPQERWRRYFVIFNAGTENDQMNHPYWVNADPEDQVIDFLRNTIDQSRSDPESIQALRKIHRYYDMLMVRKQRDINIRLKWQEVTAAATRQELEELQASQSMFKSEFEALVRGDPETASNPTIPSASQHDTLLGLATPTGMSMQRSYSGRGPDMDMNNLDSQLIGPLPDPGSVMAQTEPRVFYGNTFSATQQSLDEVMMRTDMAMDPAAHSNTINSWGHEQWYDQPAQTLGCPIPGAHASDSGIGSSRPSANPPISSANSTEDNPRMSLFNHYVTPSESTSPTVDLGSVANASAFFNGNASNRQVFGHSYPFARK